MTTRRRNLLFLLGVVALAAVGFALARPAEGLNAGALAAVPRESFAVVTIDVPALRASPLAKPALANTPGLGQLADTCGFDPLARVRELVVALPEEETGDFGVVALGDVKKDELIGCAKKVLAARGAEAKTTERGAFTLLSASEDASAPRIALKDGEKDGLLVIGRGPWHAAMLETLEGKRPGLDARGPHGALRSALASAKPRTVIGTFVLPKALRDRLKRDMEAETEGKPNAAFAGVLAVETAAVAVTAGTEAELTAILRCETAEACAEVKKLIEKKRLGLSQDFGVRLVGLGPLIDSLAVTAEGTELRATARAPAEDVARAIDRIIQLKAPKPKPTAPSEPPALPPASAAPRDAGADESVRARPRDAARE